jgi:hypothetical protein
MLSGSQDCRGSAAPIIEVSGVHPQDEQSIFRKIRLITAIPEKSLMVGTTISPAITTAHDEPV